MRTLLFPICKVRSAHPTGLTIPHSDKTTGTVTHVDSHVTTDQYGRQHTTYYIRYQFMDKAGRTYHGESSVGSRYCRVGETINVYYLPDNPERNRARL